MNQHRRTQKAFTLIELSLAMTFVAILMISIALLTIQVSRLYTRGTVMRDVNQAGVDITRDIQQSIAAVDGPDMVKVKTIGSGNGVVSVLCFGSTSYVIKDAANTGLPGLKIRLAKVHDTASALCADPVDASKVIASANADTSQELLVTAGGRELAVYGFKVADRTILEDDTGGGALVTVKLTIGTSQTSEVSLTDSKCKPPADNDSGAEYCAINQFVITGRVSNTYSGGGL